MKGHSFWGKLTAMLLALMLALPGSLVAFAEGNENVIDGDVSYTVGVYADEYSGDSSLIVNGNVTVTPEKDEEYWHSGAQVNAFGDVEAELTVNGDVTVESNAGANGVNVYANDGATAEATVGDVSVTSAESATAVSVQANDGSSAEASVGDVSVTAADSASALNVYSNDGSVTVEAGQLHAESGHEDQWSRSEGLYIQTQGKDASASAAVEDIQADVGIYANNHGGEMTVSAGSIEAAETGIRIYTDLTSEWNTEIITEAEFDAAVSDLTPMDTWENGDGTSSSSYYADDIWYYDYGENSSDRYIKNTQTRIENPGTTDVNVESIAVEGSDAQGGISVSTWADDHSVVATVEKDVSVSSTDDNYVTAVGVYNSSVSDVTVSVGGNVTLDAKSGEVIDINNAGGNTTLSVEGDVTSSDSGIYAYSYGGEAEIAIGGNVQAENYGLSVHQSQKQSRVYQDTEPEKSESDDIFSWRSVYNEETDEYEDIPFEWYNPDKDIYYNADGEVWTLKKEQSEGSTSVEVGGNVSVKGDFYSTGISVDNSNEDSPVTLNIGGNVSAEAAMYASGVNAHANSGATLEVEIQGKVTAAQSGAEKAESNSAPYVAGVGAYAYDGGILSIEVMGGLEVSGEQAATGLSLEVDGKDSSVNTEIKGDIIVEGKDDVWAVEAYGSGGALDLGVTGNVTSSGDGLALISSVWKDWEESDVKLPLDESEYIRTSTWTDEDGKEVSEKYYRHVDGDKVYWYNSKGETWIETPGEETVAADIRAEVTGDVSAKQDAVVINVTNDKAVLDLIVDGTVSGDKNSIVLEETTLTDNLTLTVWEIKENANGNLVERYKDVMTDAEKYEYDRKYLGADTDVEQAIQYIIRIEQPEKGGTLSADGTKDYEGYKVAKQGDNLILKVNLEKDYEIVSAFNGTDTKVQLLKDASGNYYLVVPRGGGVCLSVNLRYVAPTNTTEKVDLKTMAEAASENGAVTVETDENGAKVIIVTAEKGAENVSMSLAHSTLKTFADRDVSMILLRSEDGTAEVRLPVAALLSASAETGSRIIVVLDNPGKVSDSVAEALKEKYDLTESTPVVVSILLRHANGTMTELASADISLKLKADHQDGMKIVFVDRQDAVSETEAEWTESAGEESGYWEIPYVTSGTYLPVLPKTK